MRITTPIADAEAMVLDAIDRRAAELLDVMLPPGLPEPAADVIRRAVNAAAERWRAEAVRRIRAFIDEPDAASFELQ